MTEVATVVAPPTAADRPGWEVLYQGYSRHYGQAPDAVEGEP